MSTRVGGGNDVLETAAILVTIARAKTTATTAATTANVTAVTITPADPIANIANRATTGRHGTGTRAANALAVNMGIVPGDMCSLFADAIIIGAEPNATVGKQIVNRKFTKFQRIA